MQHPTIEMYVMFSVYRLFVNNASGKKAAVSELQPVVIQSESANKMSSYNPISVDYALRKAIGSYEFC